MKFKAENSSFFETGRVQDFGSVNSRKRSLLSLVASILLSGITDSAWTKDPPHASKSQPNSRKIPACLIDSPDFVQISKFSTLNGIQQIQSLRIQKSGEVQIFEVSAGEKVDSFSTANLPDLYLEARQFDHLPNSAARKPINPALDQSTSFIIFADIAGDGHSIFRRWNSPLEAFQEIFNKVRKLSPNSRTLPRGPYLWLLPFSRFDPHPDFDLTGDHCGTELERGWAGAIRNHQIIQSINEPMLGFFGGENKFRSQFGVQTDRGYFRFGLVRSY